MRFEDIVGQSELIDQLKEMVDQQRVSHALLFVGREGSGALPMALAFSTYVIEQEEKKAPPATATGMFGEPVTPSPLSHPSAEKAKQYLHPDIHYSFPSIKKSSSGEAAAISNEWMTEWRTFLHQNPYGNLFDWLETIGAENKQGKITAAECEDISRKLYLKSFEGSYKILIQWLPELMGNEGNKLLKLIEEPPPNTLFLLVSENEDLVLPTIISRCQTVRVPPIRRECIEQALRKRYKQQEEQASQIALASEGNFREALHFIQHTEHNRQGHLRQWLNAVAKADLPSLVQWVDQTGSNGREQQKQLLRYFLHLIELAVRIRAIGENKMPMSGPDVDFAIRLNHLCDIHQLEGISKEIDQSLYFIERNANGKMLFMALSIRLLYLIKHQTAIELIG
jgi:DNA polymerase-3 subunit delta'